MAYLIEDSTPLKEQLIAVFSEQIQIIRTGLGNYPEIDPEGLHNARRSLKRLRSLLRLFRKKKLRGESKTLRKRLTGVARALSEFRDKEVILSTIHEWESQRDDPVFLVSCRAVTYHVEKSIDRAFLTDDSLNSVVNEVNAVEYEFKESLVQHITNKLLAKGMVHGNMCLMTAYGHYMESPSVNSMHELRKRAKDLVYHQELLAQLFPTDKEHFDNIRLFESLMGKARDCDLIHVTIDRVIKQANAKELHDEVKLHCESHKAHLLEHAMAVDLFPSLPESLQSGKFPHH